LARPRGGEAWIAKANAGGKEVMEAEGVDGKEQEGRREGGREGGREDLRVIDAY